MSNDLKKIDEPLDNFEGYEDRVDGDDRPQGGRVIQGSCLKFTNDNKWRANDEELSDKLELIVIDVARIVQKWKDQLPVETLFLAPHQKFPDVKVMNERESQNEWREGPDGKRIGPWQAQHVVYLLHLKTMARYTYPTSTVGGAIAVRDLVEAVKTRRRYQANQYAVVTLDDTYMKTRFGGRQRPEFVIKGFITLGPGHDALSVEAADDREPRQLTHQDRDRRDDGNDDRRTKRGVQSFRSQPNRTARKSSEDDLNDPLDDLLGN